MSMPSTTAPSRTAVIICAIMLFALILVVARIAARTGSVEPEKHQDTIQVVKGVDVAAAIPPSTIARPVAVPTPPPQSPMAATDVQNLMSLSFPLLGAIEARCDGPHCEIEALAAVPTGEEQLSAYEDMIRSGIPTTLYQRGHSLTEPVQIEEVGENEVRLRVRTSMSGMGRVS